MPDALATSNWLWCGALFAAGFLGSVHCLGMCGPILLTFHRLLPSNAETAHRRRRLALNMAFYHGGRIWTYALMGGLAAWFGAEVQRGADAVGWQRPVSLVLAGLVIFSGLLVGWGGSMKILRSMKILQGAAGSCSHLLGARGGWLGALLRTPQPSARLLVGMVMGFLPCAMTYSAMAVAATLPTPLHGALAMACFGLGTLPALTLALAWIPSLAQRLGRLLGASYGRLAGSRSQWAGLLLVAVGLFMLWRAWHDPAAHLASASGHLHGMP